jgi:hypothetical protein
VATTNDVYGHLIGGEKQEATEAITDALCDSGPEIDQVDGQTG